MVIIGAAALIFFGPDQLPKVARRAGQVIRDVQNTSQSFIREMEHAADASDERETAQSMSPPYEYRSYAEPSPAPAPPAAEPASPEAAAHEATAHDVPMHDPSGTKTPDRTAGVIRTARSGEPPIDGSAHEDRSGI